MKCDTVLARLLDAELDELQGKGPGDVAAHVRDCARCGAVATRLLADTRVLAARSGVNRASSPAARPILWGAALAGAAAAVTLLVLLRPTQTSQSARTAAIPALTPQADALMKAPVPVRPTRFAPTPPATAVRFVASQPSEHPTLPTASEGVSVAPASGTRSAVLATRNSKITVVWLY